MENKKNILEICNQLWIWWTEKTMQIFCKYLNKDKYNIFSCGIFSWWEREAKINEYSKDLLIANWDIDLIKKFTIKNKIDIVHWHSITYSWWENFNKSIELLKFFKESKIKVIETCPFSLYNEKIDNLLDLKLFVSKNSLLKFFIRYWKNIKNKNKYNFLYNPLDIEELEKNKINRKDIINERLKLWVNEKDTLIWFIWRDDLWRWDDNFIFLIEKFKNKKNIKFLFKKIPDYYKKIIYKKGLEKKCIFLDLSSSEYDISIFHQIIDINLHDTRLWETYWLSIAESIFYDKIVFTPNIDFKNNYIYDRNSWQFEFSLYYNKIYFYNWREDLLVKVIKVINKCKSLKNKSNILDIYSTDIIKKFEEILYNNCSISFNEKELQKYNNWYNLNYRRKENIFIKIFNNFKWIYYYLIIKNNKN